MQIKPVLLNLMGKITGLQQQVEVTNKLTSTLQAVQKQIEDLKTQSTKIESTIPSTIQQQLTQHATKFSKDVSTLKKELDNMNQRIAAVDKVQITTQSKFDVCREKVETLELQVTTFAQVENKYAEVIIAERLTPISKHVTWNVNWSQTLHTQSTAYTYFAGYCMCGEIPDSTQKKLTQHPQAKSIIPSYCMPALINRSSMPIELDVSFWTTVASAILCSIQQTQNYASDVQIIQTALASMYIFIKPTQYDPPTTHSNFESPAQPTLLLLSQAEDNLLKACDALEKLIERVDARLTDSDQNPNQELSKNRYNRSPPPSQLNLKDISTAARQLFIQYLHSGALK